jgi:hypothetical protein
MSPLRTPTSLAEPQHVDTGEAVLRFELLEELDAAVSRAERRVEQALAALQSHEAAEADPALRAQLLDSAADAVWRLIVQHEACDVTDHSLLLQRFGVPPAVLARLGATPVPQA